MRAGRSAFTPSLLPWYEAPPLGASLGGRGVLKRLDAQIPARHRRPTPRVAGTRGSRANPEVPGKLGEVRSMMSRKRVASWLLGVAGLLMTLFFAFPALAVQAAHAAAGAPPVHHGGEAELVVPKLDDASLATFLG